MTPARTAPVDRRGAPWYARMLRLRSIRPGELLCFLFFEGMVALGALLGFAELTSWWVVPVLPAAVAVMVKINDLVAPRRAWEPAPVERPRASRLSLWNAPTVALPVCAGAAWRPQVSAAAGRSIEFRDVCLPTPALAPGLGRSVAVRPPRTWSRPDPAGTNERSFR